MAKPQKDEKTGVYYFRKGVPLALREAVGLTELRKSLGTKDPAEAKRRHAEVALEVDAEWDRLRAALKLGEGSRDPERRPQLISLSQKDAHALAGEFYREFVAENEANPGSADRWTERLLAMATALPLSRREPGAPSHIWNYSMQPNMVAARMFSREVRSFLERRNLALNTLGFRLLSSAVALAMRDAALRLRRNADGDYSPDAAAARYPSAEGVLAQALAPRGRVVTVEELLEKWSDSSPAAISTKQSWSGKLRNLARFVGKEDMADITQMDVARWRDHRKKTGTSPRTISEGDLAGTHAIFAWAVGEATLETFTVNPVTGVTMAYKAPAKLREKGFKISEAELVLRATLEPFDGLTEAGAAVRRWVPWLCAFSGARVGEITQLHHDNVFEESLPSGDKVWCMRLTPEDGSIKTSVAREIPLHPQVFEQGFIDYVRRRKGKPLFYEPGLARKPGTHHRQADKAAERLAVWVRNLGIDKAVQPNHAWRHRFESQGRVLAVRKDILDHITGHGPSDVAAEYGDYFVEALYKAICMFPRYLQARPTLVETDTSAGGISILAGQKLNG
jgi:hypothetical protein